ncbi:hypothetical protein AUQ48_00935 [Kocuria flava]|uniref:DUF350 domain-containing protein n=1 Tax=Kocuria flava TaxID=446860 RepID=A0A2N4SYL3_9MICC|nr:DUF350 domain-containing protein [Kocuria flava]PLC11078.1 hypothetical protein AUQ48_00935 [Kocuria flava]
MDTVIYEVGAAAAYGLVGLALMALGYLVVDLLTPGRLHSLIWTDRNRGSVVVLSSSVLAVAVVVRQAILASEDGLAAGLVSTGLYGLVGLALMALSFLVLDALTPGKLGELVTDERLHPAVWVTAAVHLSVGLVVAAAIS